ncbi:MAG: formylglycine-generating enzyme family protein [Bacteroidales bacterium]|nr:formylglycine-generating enzyme family protein [Bacteroidales bacterium]
MATIYNNSYPITKKMSEDGPIISFTQKFDKVDIDMKAVYVQYRGIDSINKYGEVVSENQIRITDVPHHNYMISSHLVTNKFWNLVIYNGKDKNKESEDDLKPALKTEPEIQEFLKKLIEKTKINYRIPTTQEWRFAAQGGLKSMGYIYSGSNNLRDVAWCKHNSAKSTGRVGLKNANELGIYDMSGNAWELTIMPCEQENDYGLVSINGETKYMACGGDYKSSEIDCQITSASG